MGVYAGDKAALAASALASGDGLMVIDVSAADVRIVSVSSWNAVYARHGAAQEWTAAQTFNVPAAAAAIRLVGLDNYIEVTPGEDDLNIVFQAVPPEGLGYGLQKFRIDYATQTAGNNAVYFVKQASGGGQTYFVLDDDGVSFLQCPVAFGSDGAAAAAGTTQGAAYAITKVTTLVISASGSADGVRLPSSGRPDVCAVANESGQTVKVYPPTGGSIDDLATNAAYSLADNAHKTFRLAGTRWLSF